MKTIVSVIILICTGVTAYAQLSWINEKGYGGTGTDLGADVATSSGNDFYVTGSFSGTVSFGTTMLQGEGNGDVFIMKRRGFQFPAWEKRYGGPATEYASAIAISDPTALYVCGYFYGDTAVLGPDTLTGIGAADIWLAKLDTAGNMLWARKAGSTGEDLCNGIAADTAGNVYICGSIAGDADFGPIHLTATGQQDMFVAKYNSDGDIIWAKTIGSPGDDAANNVSLDNAGHFYLTGYFEDTVSFGSYTLSPAGYRDMFIAGADTSGNFTWAHSGGSSTGYDAGWSLDATTGSVYVTGFFADTATFGTNTVISKGDKDIFIAKYDTQGMLNAFTTAGGKFPDAGTDIAVLNDWPNVAVSGTFADTAMFGTKKVTGYPGGGIFVAFYQPSLSGTPTVITAGGNAYDRVGGFAFARPLGPMYSLLGCLTGTFQSNSIFNTSVVNQGMVDIFITDIAGPGDGVQEIDDTHYPITLSPNPTTGSFTIQHTVGSYTQLSVYDGVGRVVHTQDISKNTEQTNVTLPPMPAGLYHVQLRGSAGVANEKLLVE